MNDFERYLDEQLSNSGFQKEWDNLEPEFNIIQTLIDAGKRREWAIYHLKKNP